MKTILFIPQNMFQSIHASSSAAKEEEEEVGILWKMFCGIKSVVFKIKMLTCLLLCCSFGSTISFKNFYNKT